MFYFGFREKMSLQYKVNLLTQTKFCTTQRILSLDCSCAVVFSLISAYGFDFVLQFVLITVNTT
jgi:hypothetical protein